MTMCSTVKDKGACTISFADTDAMSTESLQQEDPREPTGPRCGSKAMAEGCCVRARLERHRRDMAGRVRVPDTWGQEELLQSWVGFSAFERFLPEGLELARSALVKDCRKRSTRQLADGLGRPASGRMGIENGC